MVDIESLIVAWLNIHTDFHWSTDVPPKRPKVFGTVERTGGGVSNVVADSPTIALQVWAPTRNEACDRAREVARMVRLMRYERPVCRVDVESLYNFPDGDSPRYQITAHFVTAGE